MQTPDASKRIASLSPEKRELLRRRLQEQQPAGLRSGPTLPTLVPDPEQRDLPFPLTDVQQVYLTGRSGFFDLGAGGNNVYEELEFTWEHGSSLDRANLALQRAIKRLTGRGGFLDLDAYKTSFLVKRLERAFQQVIARHEMLRAVTLPDGQQRILPSVPHYPIKLVDLRGKDPQFVEDELRRTRERMLTAKEPVDRWPLFEVFAHRLDGERLLVHMRIDTLLIDGKSRVLLVQDWLRFMGAPGLPPMECSYRDYAITWAAFQESELYQRARSYWTNQLPEFPPAPDLPLTQPISPQVQAFFVDRAVTLLEPDAWQRLKARAARSDLTPSSVVARAFFDLIASWSTNQRFTVSLEGSYRPPIHPQIGDIVGNFNTIYLLAVEPHAGTFEARAKRLQQKMAADLEQWYFSGFQVLRELRRVQGGSSRAFTPIFFNSVIEYSHPSYQQSIGKSSGANAVLAFKESFMSAQIPQVLIMPVHGESAEGALECKWQSVEEVFPAGLIDDMLRSYTAFLRRLADDEAAWQETARQLVPPDQLAQRAAINATDAPFPPGLLHKLFLAQAHLRPRHAAVLAPGQTLSYAELARRATLVSRRLRDLGARPNTLVAVVMEKGWEQVVAVLGVLESGAAYLPIDPAAPPGHLRSLLGDGQVALALTQSCLDAQLDWPAPVERLCVDTLVWAGPHDPALEPIQDQGDLAYVVYSCGAGGAPQGVMIEHRAAVNTICDLNQRFEVGPDDRVLALAPLHSDLAVYDLFGVLAAGGTIILPNADATRDPAHWAELIARENVTIWNGTPALLDRLVACVAGRPDLSLRSLRLALLSRDPVPLTLPDRLKALAVDATVVSLGGAAETAVWSTIYPVESVDPSASRILSGKPMHNQRVHVLNEALEPCPIWVTGELYIGGSGLARGYLGQPDMTAERFIPNPLAEVTGDGCWVLEDSAPNTQHPTPNTRLYRTGDLARYLPDGNIELLGRPAEVQVTTHDYHIDLRRIEAALERHPDVRAAVVLKRAAARGEQHLVAYVVPKIEDRGLKIEDSGSSAPEPLSSILYPLSSELRGFLQPQLPDYMIPSAFVMLDALPLTADGRVDRQALPAPDLPPAAPQQTFVVPRGPLELQLARVWEDLFETGPVGVTANFFELGGDSFMAVRLLNRIQELFGADLPVAAFLQEPTVEHLARIIHEATTERLVRALSQQTTTLRRPPVVRPRVAESSAAPPASALQSTAAAAVGQRAFMLIWFGQLISIIGSGLTGFALSVWVYQQTGSVTQLTLIPFFGMLPMILVLPVAGALVDRWDRRRALIFSNLGLAAGTLVLIALFATGLFQVWHIYVIVAISSVFNAFQFPAFSAATTQLVPKEQLGRASGMVQLAQGMGQLLSPVLAGLLVRFIVVQGVILIDFATFLIALLTLLIVRIPRPKASTEGRAGQGSLARESTYGWTYIKQRPGLLLLLLFFALSNFLVGAVIVLSTPLVLSFATPGELGTVLSASGLGLLGGGILMTVLGGPRRRIYGVFGGLLLSGVSVIVAGLAPSALLIGAAALFFTAGAPIMTASSQAIWQRKIAPDVQGRAFAIRAMISTASLPVAYLVSGPLADFVFNPLLVRGGPLAGSIGRIIGVGPGRGIGLMFIVLGILTIVIVIAGYLNPRLRRVEEELPDAIADEPPAGVERPGQPLAGPSVA